MHAKGSTGELTVKHTTEQGESFFYLLLSISFFLSLFFVVFKKWNLELCILFIFIHSLIKFQVQQTSEESGLGSYLDVKTCEVFLCFLAIIFLGSIVLTSQWLLCIHCFTSLISFTGLLHR